MYKNNRNNEFGNNADDENTEGSKNGKKEDEEKIFLKQDTEFMNRITEIAEQYDNGLEGVMQLKDPKNNEIIFNVLVKINKEDIFIMVPLLPEENPVFSDVRFEIDFNKVYDLIETAENDMGGGCIERPPWGPSAKIGETVNNIVDCISMYLKIRGIINDAKVYQEEHEKNIKNIAKEFLKLMMTNDNNRQPKEMNEENDRIETVKFGDEVEKNKEITGKIIRRKLEL